MTNIDDSDVWAFRYIKIIRDANYVAKRWDSLNIDPISADKVISDARLEWENNNSVFPYTGKELSAFNNELLNLLCYGFEKSYITN